MISTLEPQQQIIETDKDAHRQYQRSNRDRINKEIEATEKLAQTDADRQAAAEVRAEGERAITALVSEETRNRDGRRAPAARAQRSEQQTIDMKREHQVRFLN